MNWQWAQKHLAVGLKVRRACWVTALYSWRDTVLWDISDTLARKCNEDGSADRVFAPHETDVDGDDWVLA